MNVALRRAMTIAEFLDREEGQEECWEFDGFEPVAMVGGTAAHARIAGNTVTALTNRLRGKPCEAFSKGLKLVLTASIRYPDVFVSCGATDNAATVAENPVVVFEILSPSTASTDQIVKNAEYRDTPGIQRSVMLAQDRIAASVFERRGTEWAGSLVTEPDAVLRMPEIGVELPLAGLHEGVPG